MVKVISFSLWGSNPNYNIGAIKNAKMSLNFYPDFECWFYIHKDSVPQKTIDELNKLSHTKIIYKYGNLKKNKPMTWRFESIDNDHVEINLSRDTDTRFLLREKLAVDEWIKSDKLFHIIRDHPDHSFKILGGMFGTKKIKNIPSWKELIEKNIKQNSARDYDQDFLAQIVYPKIKDTSMIHSNFWKFKDEEIKQFPISYCRNYYYIGEYIYHDEKRSQKHFKKIKRFCETQCKIDHPYFIIFNN